MPARSSSLNNEPPAAARFALPRTAHSQNGPRAAAEATSSSSGDESVWIIVRYLIRMGCGDRPRGCLGFLLRLGRFLSSAFSPMIFSLPNPTFRSLANRLPSRPHPAGSRVWRSPSSSTGFVWLHSPLLSFESPRTARFGVRIMIIKFVCPQGHRLSATEAQAGMDAFCPKCKSAVKVPKRRPVSDSSICAILGEHEPSDRDSRTAPTNKVEVTRNCPACHARLPGGTHICPSCRRYIPVSDVRLRGFPSSG